MKFKLISVLCLLSLLAFPFYSSAQSRDPGKVYKVAILPFIIHSQENLDYLREGINDILTSRITVEGRIIVIERTVVERILYEMRPMRLDETVATQVGTRAGADYVVLGSITKIGNYISLDARLIPITEDKPPLGAYTQHKGIDDVMTKIGDFAQDIGFRIIGRRAATTRPSDSKSSHIIRSEREIGRSGPEGLSFKKSQTFGFEIKGLDIGDVDGDKKNEVVVIDSHNIYVFKYDGDKLNLFRKIEAGKQHNFLTLDVADTNRNGHAEIIVTSVAEDNLQSLILEYEQGEFRTITRRSDWFFRVLEHPKDGPFLIGQLMGAEGVPVGPVFKMIWKKNTFDKGPKLPLPSGTNVFGLATADIRNQGALDFIALEDSERISIASMDGKFSWSSRQRYGGTNNFYDTYKKQDPLFRIRATLPSRIFITGRLIARDLDGDGVYEVIVNKNHTSSFFQKAKTFEKGEIYNLVWEENSLTTNWKTLEIDGYIPDFQVKDADNDGDEELVVVLVESQASGALGDKGASKILFYKLF